MRAKRVRIGTAGGSPRANPSDDGFAGVLIGGAVSRKRSVTPDVFRGLLGRGGAPEPLAFPLAAEWNPDYVRGDGVLGAGSRISHTTQGPAFPKDDRASHPVTLRGA